MELKLIFIKRKWIIAITIVLIISVIWVILKKDTQTTFLPIQNKVIALDAGHGGVDPGKVGKLKVTEEALNLKITLKLRKIIEQNGGVVVLTRNNGEGLYTDKSTSVKEKKTEDLKNRKKLVDENDIDVFDSIHLNSFEQEKYYGAQTFYKDGCKDSEKLANDIQKELRNSLDKDNTRVPQPRDSIYLIREVEKPAVLIEGGFLSNEREEKLLNDDKYQEKLAWAIYIGITKHFNEKEN